MSAIPHIPPRTVVFLESWHSGGTHCSRVPMTPGTSAVALAGARPMRMECPAPCRPTAAVRHSLCPAARSQPSSCPRWPSSAVSEGKVSSATAASVMVCSDYAAPPKGKLMPEDCLLCQIIAGNEPAEIIASSDNVIAIEDKYPQGPVHVLVVPRQHFASAHELDLEDADLLSECFDITRRVARSKGVAHGYRVATNVGREGGQAIPHLHFHVLGGRQLHRIDSGPPLEP